MKKTKVIYKNIDVLIPYINNPRNNEGAIDAVASSINNFGFKVPIVIDKNNEIVNGHTRYKAAKKLKLTEVPVIVAVDDKQMDAIEDSMIAGEPYGFWEINKAVQDATGLMYTGAFTIVNGIVDFEKTRFKGLGNLIV